MHNIVLPVNFLFGSDPKAVLGKQLITFAIVIIDN